MELENLPRWQWILIGLVLGLVLSAARIWMGSSLDKNSPKVLAQSSGQVYTRVIQEREKDEKFGLFWQMAPYFDLDILNPSGGPRPYFRDIVIHPNDPKDPKGKTWVTLTVYRASPPKFSARNARPTTQNAAEPPIEESFCYPVDTPYVPEPNYLLDPPPGKLKLVPKPQYDQSHADTYRQIGQAEKDLAAVEAEIRAERLHHTPENDPVFTELAHKKFALTKVKDAPHPELTIEYYLQQLLAKYPSAGIQYHFARLETPGAILLMYTTGMVILVGGIWPTVVQWLRPKDRRAQAEERRIKLTPSRPTKPTKPRGEMSPQDWARLTTLEQEMEKKLQAQGADVSSVALRSGQSPAATTATTRPVKQLAGTDEAAKSAAEKPKDKKDFGATGEDYYPTEVHAPAPPKEP